MRDPEMRRNVEMHERRLAERKAATSAPAPPPRRWGDPAWHEENARDLFLKGWNADSNTEIKAMWGVFDMAAAQVHASLAVSARLRLAAERDDVDGPVAG